MSDGVIEMRNGCSKICVNPIKKPHSFLSMDNDLMNSVKGKLGPKILFRHKEATIFFLSGFESNLRFGQNKCPVNCGNW